MSAVTVPGWTPVDLALLRGCLLKRVANLAYTERWGTPTADELQGLAELRAALARLDGKEAAR